MVFDHLSETNFYEMVLDSIASWGEWFYVV